MTLKLTSHDVDGVSVVALDGRIVLGEESTALREKLKGLIAAGKQKIVLNMDNVTYIDSAGLGTLIAAHVSAKNKGCFRASLPLGQEISRSPANHQAAHGLRRLRYTSCRDQQFRGNGRGRRSGGKELIRADALPALVPFTRIHIRSPIIFRLPPHLRGLAHELIRANMYVGSGTKTSEVRSLRQRIVLLEAKLMLEPAIADERKKRKELTAKRNLLFAEYLKNPQDIRLALEIKLIDDQVALSIEQTERKPATRK